MKPLRNATLAGALEDAADALSGQANKRSLVYLRVSSDAQVNTDLERDGLSLPAQRRACARKSQALGAVVADEFVERGETGKTTLNRPALQAMLQRLKVGDIDYVIVHKVDRLARKRADDSLIVEAIRAEGAQLVSVSENIDETPSGMLMHGIMASIAEFYSLNLAQEVLKGTTEKARRGGAPFRAPVGYLNTREMVDGREVRTIGLDPERAPLIRSAFELYRTGRYALSDLQAILEARGLRSRATPKQASRTITANRLSEILRNDFYAGIVRYRGQVSQGRHEPLVSEEVFAEVQAVLAVQRKSGERSWKHHHYLRGSVYCAECKGRLFYTRTNGNGGLYEYFVCKGRQRTSCSQPHHRVEAVEHAVEEYYARVHLTSARRRRIAELAREFSVARSAISAPQRQQATRELQRLKQQEKKLLDLHLAESISSELYAEEYERITRERVAVKQTVAHLQGDEAEALRTLDLAGTLTDRMQDAYVRADPNGRRLFNQAFFERIWIDQEEVADVEMASPFADLLDPRLVDGATEAQATGLLEPTELARLLDPQGKGWGDASPVQGWKRRKKALGNSKTADPSKKVGGLYVLGMVEIEGLKPSTSSLPAMRSNQLSYIPK